MNSRCLTMLTCATIYAALPSFSGCKREAEPGAAPGTDQRSETVESDEPVRDRTPSPETDARVSAEPSGKELAERTGGTDSETPLSIEGITFVVPAGWVPETVAPGPFAAKAAFRLPRAAGDDQDGSLRITHYPNMKGMNEANIDRWLSQVTREDGSPHTRDDATIQRTSLGDVELTVVDVSGTLLPGMGGGASLPDQRMIAAILDHPQGPHFVRVAGPIETIARWEDSMDAFLKSAKTR